LTKKNEIGTKSKVHEMTICFLSFLLFPLLSNKDGKPTSEQLRTGAFFGNVRQAGYNNNVPNEGADINNNDGDNNNESNNNIPNEGSSFNTNHTNTNHSSGNTSVTVSFLVLL
jgi:hypothetical protein